MTDRTENRILTELPSDVETLANDLVEAAADCQGSPARMLEWLHRRAKASWPVVGEHTLQLWELLARTAAVDLVAVRALEPHLDALSIIEQAAGTGTRRWSDIDTDTDTWGVFAAEGKGLRLEASATASVSSASSHTEFRLNGIKPWCSLASTLDYALVSAHVPEGRQLFAVDLRHEGVRVDPIAWVSRGLSTVPSGPVSFTDVPATAVGEVGWYLERPGFAWGGGGVAACWFGGAYGLYRDIRAAAQQREPDQLALASLGRAARAIRDGRALLREAAERVDRGQFLWADALALRGSIVAICEDLLDIASQALGPAALAFDDAHARRVADLAMYVQQHHGARDDAALGEAILSDTNWSPTDPMIGATE
ncbi:acyl-CoA dehydrogenase family protein [Gulosibacter chungangensis]|uniref:Acyl-CoA dehydrogenase n=1 Tax=Gulosibacter chungangensis TaxID=979746 RepID=A0A7J5B7F1_9MICO|nr:acyl-CoA dehydrogenase family protein [Gulosibacter chungangensis]KAB1640847.1 acyl-CoA dehydrogenase [Gulosibacter chungangensis]